MNRRLKSALVSGISLASVLMLLTSIAGAQLTDITQTTPNVPGGAIAKSLYQQIGNSQGDIFTPGSSSYIIARDPARAIRRGRQVFQRKFTFNQSAGPRVNDDSTGNIQDNPAFGAGLVDSCAGVSWPATRRRGIRRGCGNSAGQPRFTASFRTRIEGNAGRRDHGNSTRHPRKGNSASREYECSGYAAIEEQGYQLRLYQMSRREHHPKQIPAKR